VKLFPIFILFFLFIAKCIFLQKDEKCAKSYKMLNMRQKEIERKFLAFKCGDGDEEEIIRQKEWRMYLTETLDKKFEITSKVPINFELFEEEIFEWLLTIPVSELSSRVYLSIRVGKKQCTNDDRAAIFMSISRPNSLENRLNISVFDTDFAATEIFLFLFNAARPFEAIKMNIDGLVFNFDKRTQQAGILINSESKEFIGFISRSSNRLYMTEKYYKSLVKKKIIRINNHILLEISKSSNCVFCGCSLSEIGRLFGYGPVCAKRYNLLWTHVARGVAGLIKLLE
jgi:hypothetical protein